MTWVLALLLAVQSGKGWLGLGFTMHTEPATAGAKPAKYLYVRQLVPGAPAAASGIQLGDVITAIDGKPVAFQNDRAALDFFAQLHEGDSLVLTVIRKTRRVQFRVRAIAPPAYAGAQWKRNYDMAARPKP